MGVLFLLITGFGIWMSVLYAKADTEAIKARSISGFLQSMLSSVDPQVAKGRDTTILRELLDDAARRVSMELAGQPEVEAELHVTIGKTYRNLGLYDPAEVHQRAAEAIYKREPRAFRRPTRTGDATGAMNRVLESSTLPMSALPLRRCAPVVANWPCSCSIRS